MGLSAKLMDAVGKSSPETILTGTLLLIVCWVIPYCIYSVYFSPLSKFPGPWLNAITRTPLSWSEIRFDIRYVKRLHDKYGPVVRIAPNEVTFIGSDAWRDIHGSKAIGKDPVHFDLETPFGLPQHLAALLNDDDHRRVRSTLRPAFSERILSEQEPIILSCVNLMIEQMGKRQKERGFVDIGMFYNLTTFDIMHYMCFSQTLGLLEAGEYTPWVNALFQMLKGGQFKSVGRKQPWLSPITKNFLLTKEQMGAVKLNGEKSIAMMNRELDKADKGQEAKGNIWAAVSKGDEEGKITREDMYVNGSFFMVAGTETSGAAATGTSFYLASEPEVLSRLQQEIRSTFSSVSEITMKSVAPLRYLNACIQEGLRMFPPAANNIPRRLPPEGAKIMGQYVPGNTIVSIPHYATYRNKTLFHRPNEYCPERWLGDEVFFEDDFDAFKPFGHGARNCIGENLAWHEMRLLLAHVIFRFDMKLRDDCKDWHDKLGASVVWEKVPLWMELTPRA